MARNYIPVAERVGYTGKAPRSMEVEGVRVIPASIQVLSGVYVVKHPQNGVLFESKSGVEVMDWLAKPENLQTLKEVAAYAQARIKQKEMWEWFVHHVTKPKTT
jgi:hypothetical protein